MDNRKESARAELERREAARAELASRNQTSMEQKPSLSDTNSMPKKLLGGVQFNAGMLPSFLASMSGDPAAKKVASGLGEEVAGQGSWAPGVGNALGSMAKYIPFGMSAGPGVARQMLAGGAFGASTAEPNQENLLLPSGPGGSAIENALIAGLLTKSLPSLMKGGGQLIQGNVKNAIGEITPQPVKDAINYLKPGKMAEEFRNSLSGANTAEGNISELGGKIKSAREVREAEALEPKNEFMGEHAVKNVLDVNANVLPDINKIASIFEKTKGEHTPERLLELNNAVKEAYQTGDIDNLINKGEKIFETEPTGTLEEKALEKELPLRQLRKSSYSKIKDVTEHYGDATQEAHDAYIENPSFYNADKLQSKIGKQIRALETKEKVNPSEDRALKIKQLQKNKDAVLFDQDKFIESLPEKYRDLYKDFRTKWATNVGVYENSGPAIRQMSKGKTKGVKPSNLTARFAHPTPEVSKIIQDIGESGRKNIIHNALRDVPIGDAKKFANKLLNMKRTHGYSELIAPETEEFANKLLKKVKLTNALKWGAGATAVGALGNEAAKHLF